MEIGKELNRRVVGVPALSPAGLLLLSLAMAGLAAFGVRRKG
ncbi:MAG: IPTL-CTERM sorting domain-containing protein [Burkholderiales bacterium]|nr:MAG: IPTL-CTERM sorting domain-containing protein [Burkholderiales bacterium]